MGGKEEDLNFGGYSDIKVHAQDTPLLLGILQDPILVTNLLTVRATQPDKLGFLVKCAKN